MSSPRPLSARQPIIYSTPSIIPHARLQPSAPINIVRMLSRPASATLSDPVKVRTMIRPKRTSETRSIGSNTRLEDRSKKFSGMGRWKLNSYEVFSLKRLPNSLLTTTKKTPVESPHGRPARRSNALNSSNNRLLCRVQAADRYEHQAVPTIVSAVSKAPTGSTHFFLSCDSRFDEADRPDRLFTRVNLAPFRPCVQEFFC